MGRLAVFKLMYFTSIIFTFIIVAVTITAAFGAQADPNQNPFMAILGLALPVLLIINLVILVYWALRRRLWVWFPLIAIIANVGYLTSIIQFSSNEKPNMPTIKVATFNIRGFNNEITGYTAKEIAHFMKKEKVDVICFQELSPNIDFNLDSINSVYKDFPYSFIPTDNGNFRISVFSKFPITNSKFIPFYPSGNCGMWVDIEVDGKPIRIFNVHMQTTNLNQTRSMLAKQKMRGETDDEEALGKLTESIENNFMIRARQARKIRSMIDSTAYPVILCGDFNDTPASFTYKQLKGDMKDGFRTNGNGYGYTYRGLYSLLRIDYILYSPRFTGVDYYSASKDWSDHNPVIIELGMYQ